MSTQVVGLRQTLRNCTSRGRAAFVPYIMAGDPNLAVTASAIRALSQAGADVIELGLPFTDPVADGATIQKAAERALKNPITINHVLRMVKDLRQDGVMTPIVLMTYANPIFAMGFAAFCTAAVASGVQGSLIVDIPPEEADDYARQAKLAGLETVFLCSPTTSPARLALVDKIATGFVYYVAREGVTGTRGHLPANITDKLQSLRQFIHQPLAVGFGISTPDQAATLAPHVDAVVVGSAMVKLFESPQLDAVPEQLAHITRDMCQAMSPHA